MPGTSGSELQNEGQRLFTKMGFLCLHNLATVQLKKIDPSGSHSSGHHLELDFLIPFHTTCLVGEITGRTGSSDAGKKFKRFRGQIDLLSKLKPEEALWRGLGVQEADLRKFRAIQQIKGFFIVTEFEEFDLDLEMTQNIACFYRYHWRLLQEYSECIGEFARYPFLEVFGISAERPHEVLKVLSDEHSLIRTPDKKIASGDIGLADIFTFEISPFKLLPISRVYRRDMLPALSSHPDKDYQRMLVSDKLSAIRKGVLRDPDFIFPNSILVSLSNDCKYAEQEKALEIPTVYGTISVIDGQHRLFSYADPEIQSQLRDTSRIMVTAIKFKDSDQEKVKRYCARTFIEINTNQTRVKGTHIDAIAYDVLGETHPKAISAQIILRVNERRGKRLQGFFQTTQTNLGIVAPATILTTLKTIMDLKRIQTLQKPNIRKQLLKQKTGYQNLFQQDIQNLSDPETLIKQGVLCVEQFFSRVAEVFEHDWPVRGEKRSRSSLYHAKIIAAFVKLLWRFIREGLDWQAITTELKMIRQNVIVLRKLKKYDRVLFDEKNSKVPSAKPSVNEDFLFLNSNRKFPESINAVIKKKK